MGRGQVMNRIQFLGIDGLQRVELIGKPPQPFRVLPRRVSATDLRCSARVNIVFLYLEVRGGKLLLRAAGLQGIAWNRPAIQ